MCRINNAGLSSAPSFKSKHYHPSLLIKSEVIHGQSVRILIDSGADHNVIKSGITPTTGNDLISQTTVRRFDGTTARQSCRLITATHSFYNFVLDDFKFT